MKKIIFFLVVIVSLFVINNLIHSIYGLWQKQDLITKAQHSLEKEKQENQRLKAEMAKVKTPQFIEEEARDKLFLVKPGEQTVLIPQELLKPTPSPAPKKPVVKPPWQQWWELFF